MLLRAPHERHDLFLLLLALRAGSGLRNLVARAGCAKARNAKADAQRRGAHAQAAEGGGQESGPGDGLLVGGDGLPPLVLAVGHLRRAAAAQAFSRSEQRGRTTWKQVNGEGWERETPACMLTMPVGGRGQFSIERENSVLPALAITLTLTFSKKLLAVSRMCWGACATPRERRIRRAAMAGHR